MEAQPKKPANTEDQCPHNHSEAMVGLMLLEAETFPSVIIQPDNPFLLSLFNVDVVVGHVNSL